jgi:DNA-directed RNA polymerase III subunit RPC1
MGTVGVHYEATSTNHVAEMERVLGIEAARHAIMEEIKATMQVGVVGCVVCRDYQRPS